MSKNEKLLTILVLLFILLIVVLYKNKNPNSSRSLVDYKDEEVHHLYKNPVTSLDNQGFDFGKINRLPLDPRYEKFAALPTCNLDKDPDFAANDVEKLSKAFSDCITPILNSYGAKPEELSKDFVKATQDCDHLPEYKGLNIDGFKNQHETKFIIFPKCKETNNMVTLGVGHDTLAEERLNVTLPDTNFYGADPIIEPNLQLYSAFGKFFPFAIGRKAGMTKFRILPNQNQKTRRYVWQDVTTIDFGYFINEVLQLKKIDFMWIDIEGGELHFIDMLHIGGVLDAHGVSVCQFNVEFHNNYVEDGYQAFRKFILTIMADQRYIFLKPRATGDHVFRLFFINIENKDCIRKYIL